jgi:hypothetical protein
MKNTQENENRLENKRKSIYKDILIPLILRVLCYNTLQ